MIKAEREKKETIVIVNRRTAVFVTRTKHVLVIGDGPQPKP
jgi:ribosomal protein S4E